MSEIGLGADFRFAVLNSTGITISTAPVGLPTVIGRLARLDPNGNLSYGAAGTLFFSATATIANNGYLTGSAQSNTSLFLAGDFLFSAFVSGNASGNLNLYLEISPDNGVTWPSPASANGTGGGFLVATLGFNSTTTASTASTTRAVNFLL